MKALFHVNAEVHVWYALHRASISCLLLARKKLIKARSVAALSTILIKQTSINFVVSFVFSHLPCDLPAADDTWVTQGRDCLAQGFLFFKGFFSWQMKSALCKPSVTVYKQKRLNLKFAEDKYLVAPFSHILCWTRNVIVLASTHLPRCVLGVHPQALMELYNKISHVLLVLRLRGDTRCISVK